MADDKVQLSTLYCLSIQTVYQHYINDDISFAMKYLPNPINYDLIRQCLANNKEDSSKLIQLCSQMEIVVWIRLLKFEAYRKTLMEFYQKLINCDHSIDKQIVDTFTQMRLQCVSEDNQNTIIKYINYGLILGSFLSEGSWYQASQDILSITKDLCFMLPANDITVYKIQLECCHRLFHTLTTFFKFEFAESVYDEITKLKLKIEECDKKIEKYEKCTNYALLYTEFSRYNYFKNQYEESYRWIKEAIRCLHEKISTPTVIQVLRQAAKVCVIKRDFVKAKYLMHQTLAMAEQHYGSGYYKLAGLLRDFGFYLLYSDHIEQSVRVYQDAYQLRVDTFSSAINNLHVAVAEEDLAYALYVMEYSSGNFTKAMEHVKQSIKTMKKLLPSGNLMLASANRVKALILEEMALDVYNSIVSDVDTKMLKKAEKLHQDALSLTKNTFGEENILTAKHYGNLGRLYQSMQKFKEAENMHLKSIRIKEKILGSDDYEVGLSIGHLASLYNYHMYKFEKAEKLYHRSIKINLKLFSESYSGLEYDYRGLIHVYEHLNNTEQYLKFNHKLQMWSNLRSRYVADAMGPDFYKILKIEPLVNIKSMFDE